MSLDLYLREYERARREAPGGPPWLARVRDEAIGQFQALGFPTTKDEEWRFTSVKPIADGAFTLADCNGARRPAVGMPAIEVAGPFGAELVFVNGRYAADLSSWSPSIPAGVVIAPLSEVLSNGADVLERHLTRYAPFRQQPFTALNTALFADGAVIRIPAHARITAPMHVRFVCADDAGEPMMHPRVLVVMGEDSQCALVESYGGPDGLRYFTNAVTEVVAGESAVLDHYKLQHEGVDGYHVASMHVVAARHANVTSHSIGFGGGLVRNDVTAVLDGEGAECTLNGLYIADRARLVDNHTTIDHARPHCASREIYKGILADRARAVFNGKIVVRPDAQKTDARQTNRALLLSDDARINTKPQLEIFANDVKCTHGAAIGQLDEDAVFYLRSRGLGALEARHLLIRAFASDVLTRMPLEPLRQAAERALLRQLERAVKSTTPSVISA